MAAARSVIRSLNKSLRSLAVALTFLCLLRQANAYSVQTHQQLIDLTWKNSIVPLLQARYPGITPAEIAEAHAYAYGGCAIQDIGYYPFGNPLFSDLTHYVRSGDFIASLLRNARTPDELAFAVGALSHYIGDTEGHADAVNPAVAVEFPKLRDRYGSSVTYEESPHSHVRTEFAFDINEIAKHRFAPLKYLDHVGLKIAPDLLARAFFETYGLRLDKTLRIKHRTAVGYNFGVRVFLPRIAYAETLLHRNSFPPDIRDAQLVRLEAELVQAGADNNWEPYRRKAGFGTHLLAGFIFIVPKIGPTSMLAIKGPTPATEQLYVASVNRSTDRLRAELTLLTQRPIESTHAPAIRQTEIPNRDLDTGQPSTPGTYRLTDQTYVHLLDTLTGDPTRPVPIGLRDDLATYFANPSALINLKNKPAHLKRVQAELATLQQMSTVPEP